MPKPYPRKERLEELIALARRYRDWTDKQLALELGRNVHNLVPDSGVPKLDLVMRLAEALDWPVDIAVRELCEDLHVAPAPAVDGRSAAELLREGYSEVNRRNHRHAAELARMAHAKAKDNQEMRQRATLLLFNCLDQLGHYTQALDVLRLALRETDGAVLFGPWLRADLAGVHYILGHYDEAEGIATSLVSSLNDVDEADPRRQPLGLAFVVRGQCQRVRAGAHVESRQQLAEDAIRDLSVGASILETGARQEGLARDGAIAHMCRGGMLEMQALLGMTPPDEALTRFLDELDSPLKSANGEQTPWLEARGWWCIYGSNVAMRHLSDPADLQHAMAILTNKADEIAEQLGHWALREHVWALEHTRRRMQENGGSGRQEDWVLDKDDLRIVTGAIGRFPTFRETGWQILRSVRLVEDPS
ncbi:MAG: hypothetical protein U0575_08415 [Phycisphaerales bacterium]